MGQRKMERETGVGEKREDRDGREKDRETGAGEREIGRETGVGRERERDRGEREEITNTKKFHGILSCGTSLRRTE